MRENSVIRLFVSIYTFISFIGISSTENVPVFMWENSQYSKALPALSKIDQESFRKILTEARSETAPILVFEEENLSPEDFTLKDFEGKTPFQHLHSLKSTKIGYWPFVKSPVKVVKELPNRTLVETSIKSIIEDPDITLHNNDVLVVNLNDARDNENRYEMLKRHDSDIFEVYKKFVNEHENIITLFTSRHSSWVTSENIRHVRNAEPEVKPTEAPVDTNRKTYGNTDVLISSGSPGIFYDNETKIQLDDFDMTTVGKNETYIVVELKSPTEKSIVIKLFYGLRAGYWSLASVTVQKGENVTDELRVKEVYAPIGFSYHCYSQTFSNFDNPKQYLTFPELQMQVFLNKTDENHSFGAAFDCVGFMTAPIWSGIFVTFILALIMTFGLTMMMDIKTMDRFDDPKGKTITINASE